MSYLHIENLYKNQTILLFKRCYAMEKIHGTSAWINWNPITSEVRLFSGGASHLEFTKLFDIDSLKAKFQEKGMSEEVYVYGEAYGGKLQGMRATYGDKLRFVAFEVRIGDKWLAVPKANTFTESIGLEFVHWVEIPTTLEAIDAERDANSIQAIRNGITEPKIREGIVLRPPEEVILNNGSRVIAKHKRDEFKETASPRKVGEDLQQLTEAKAIVDEWVTEERLTHIITGNNIDLDIKNTGQVIKLMSEDILREAGIEIEGGKLADKEIGRATALMFKRRLKQGALI